MRVISTFAQAVILRIERSRRLVHRKELDEELALRRQAGGTHFSQLGEFNNVHKKRAAMPNETVVVRQGSFTNCRHK
jgi:hypothetical protein